MPTPTVFATWAPAPEHRYGDHPEGPHRLRGLQHLPRQEDGTVWLPADPAPVEALARVHDPRHIAYIEAIAPQGPAIIDYAPTYVTPTSYDDARRAAGGTLAVLDAVLRTPGSRGFAWVRPPGHHATRTQAMGFCLFNHVAVAAAHALAQGFEPVLIVDFDAHHGNGTQAIWRAEPRVAYFSTHQEGIYPGTGDFEDEPQARGRIVNVPLPAHTGDRGYARVIEQVLLPWARALAPAVVLVSAGFDAHWRDPLTQLGLSAQGFAHWAQALVALADETAQGRLAFVLEGGYDPQAVAESGLAVWEVLHGRAAPAGALGPAPYPEPEVADRVAYARRLHGIG